MTVLCDGPSGHYVQPRLHTLSDDPGSGEPLDGSGFEREIPEDDFWKLPVPAPLTPEEDAHRG